MLNNDVFVLVSSPATTQRLLRLLLFSVLEFVVLIIVVLIYEFTL